MDAALLDKALEMPPNERVTFAELILASIDYEEDEIRQSWIQEVNARMKAFNEGRANLLDFESLYHED
ncbi:MAG: addiction module protein [Ignavibacteriales bacterium]|nr:addiction module protein [Ignavibacteriales bacterium]